MGKLTSQQALPFRSVPFRAVPCRAVHIYMYNLTVNHIHADSYSKARPSHDRGDLGSLGNLGIEISQGSVRKHAAHLRRLHCSSAVISGLAA